MDIKDINTESPYRQLLFHLFLLNRANSTSPFGGSDTQELFESNCKNPETKALLQQHGWLDRPIEYRYNQQGYRCPEFDDRENFIALGCSFTEGVGVPVEQSWPAMLSSTMGLHGWNLGIGGASQMSVARLLPMAVNLLKPKFVVILLPPSSRIDVIAANGFSDTYSPSHQKDAIWFTHAKVTSSYLKNWFANDENAALSTKMVLAYLESISKELSMPIIIINSDQARTELHYMRDLARDLRHDGPRVSRSIADMFLERLVEKKIV